MQRTGIAADRGWAGNLRATRPELYANPPDLPKRTPSAMKQERNPTSVLSTVDRNMLKF